MHEPLPEQHRRPPQSDDDIRTCAYGALNRQLAEPVIDYLKYQRSHLLLDLDSGPSLWPSTRQTLIRDFRERIEALLEQGRAAARTPHGIGDRCQAFLEERNFLGRLPDSFRSPAAGADGFESPSGRATLHAGRDHKHSSVT